jgi:hypothetical protein
MATTYQGTIVAAKRLNNSVNGNPRWDVTFRFLDHKGREEFQILTTSSDAACSYDVENVLRSREIVVIGLTRAGRVETISRLVEDAPTG